MEEFISKDDEKKILMKGKDIVQTNYSLKPVENKIFQVILYNNQKQKHNGLCECEIPISEFENLIGNKSERDLKNIEAKLKSIAKKSLIFYNSKIKGEYQLIAGHEVIKERNSINVIMLERVVEIMRQYQENKRKLSPYAPINLSLFFELRSFYAQKLYDELRLWSRHNKEISHVFSLEEIRFITGVGEKYPKWCNFSQKVLDVAVKEINEKAKMKVSYIPKKVNRVVKKIEFKIYDYEPHIYFNNSSIINLLENLKKIDISKLDENFRIYIDKEIQEIESVLFNNSSIDDKESLEKKIENLKNEINAKSKEINLSTNIIIEECINISKGALALFKKDFEDIDFNNSEYYKILIDAFAKTIDRTKSIEISSDKNYKYFKAVLKGDLELFENQKEFENIEEDLEVSVDNKVDIEKIVEDNEDMQGFLNNNSNDTKLIDNDLEMVKNALIVLEPIIGRTSYQCWINSGIVDVDIKSRAINIICANSFTARIVKERYSNYIEEIIKGLYSEIEEISYIS